MNLLKDIHDYVYGINQNESLCSFLEKSMSQELAGKSFPRDYYQLTEITNPTLAYYSRKNPGVKKPKELARKLSLGNHLHYLASFWFKNIEGFVTDEATLDGIWVGIPRIRGRIDHRINESIIEFKTKPKLPKDVNDVFALFPQDLEQLSFYSVMHPHNPKENYLVFMEDSKPYSIIAFKVFVKEFSSLKNMIKGRIKLLDAALKEDKPKILGRCRYHISGCHFDNENICECGKLNDIDINSLKKAITLKYDPDFTKRVKDARDKSAIRETFSISIRDLIAPRKHYMQEVLGIHSDYDEKYLGYKSCLWQCVKNIKSKLKIGLNINEINELYSSKFDIRLRSSSRGIKLKSSTHQKGRIVPYLLKVSATSSVKRTKYPHDYYLAELGINCAIHGIDKGIIFVLYPELNKLVRVFEVNFKNLQEIKKEIISRINLVQESERNKDIFSLPSCPQFMNDGGKCQLMGECNSKGRGCI